MSKEKSKKRTKDGLICLRCGKNSYRARIYGWCDECVVEAFGELQEAMDLTHPELNGMKIDPKHYPIEDHAEHYGIEWLPVCECEGKPGVWKHKE